MVRRLTLICHGATAATRAAAFPDDEPLEAAAVEKARVLAPFLGKASQVLTSPMQGARETAQALGLAAVPDANLRDWDCGSWRGRSYEDLQAHEADGLTAWRFDSAAAPHGGESLDALLGRTADWVEELAGPGDKVIAVTHPAIIRAVMVVVMEARTEAFWRIDVEPLSITQLRSDGRRWTLRALGVRPLERGGEE
ncbi:histidine phosphatase family protein [Xanthobacteraceae bacterium A53D]